MYTSVLIEIMPIKKDLFLYRSFLSLSIYTCKYECKYDLCVKLSGLTIWLRGKEKLRKLGVYFTLPSKGLVNISIYHGCCLTTVATLCVVCVLLERIHKLEFSRNRVFCFFVFFTCSWEQLVRIRVAIGSLLASPCIPLTCFPTLLTYLLSCDNCRAVQIEKYKGEAKRSGLVSLAFH